MGLDQYANAIDNNGEKEELAYWRKHPNLQGFMENLWYEKGCPGKPDEPNSLGFVAAHTHRCGGSELDISIHAFLILWMLFCFFLSQCFFESFDGHFNLLHEPWQREVDASFASRALRALTSL